jgi:DnaA family protein
MALPLQLQDHAVFDSFLKDGNESLVAFLVDAVDSQAAAGGWIWGPPATGKTHLLQACCARAGRFAVYLPLGQLRDAGPGILEGMAAQSLICIDDVDKVAGDAQWESALFGLYNQVLEGGGAIFVAASAPVRECGFELADLASRLSQLPAFRVEPLDEEGRLKALQLRARHRGLTLPDETARYLLTRSRRDMASLYQLLDRLDRLALEAQRKLTVPFVRGVIANED